MTDLIVEQVGDPSRLREVADFFVQVWGRNDEGVPIGTEMLRSLMHAGGMVSIASAGDILVGAAVLGRGMPGECYSYLAAARPGYTDLGIGRALKLHQRDWALAAGLHTMVWTFDPLVARNARFNLVKLGAVAGEYEIAFYGEMHDTQNQGEIGDRLVAHWHLGSARVKAAVEGNLGEPPAPRGEVLGIGPDGVDFRWQDGDEAWVRVPGDIMTVRSRDREQANAWRLATREAFLGAFADGFLADGLAREGIYHLSRAGA